MIHYNIHMYIFFALLSAVFAALVTIVAKLALRGVDAVLLTTVRAVIMALLLLTVSLFKGDLKNTAIFTSRDWLFVALSALFGALSWLFYFIALKFAPSVKGVYAIDRASIIFLVFLAWILLKEPLTWQAILGAVLVFIGVLLMN